MFRTNYLWSNQSKYAIKKIILSFFRPSKLQGSFSSSSSTVATQTTTTTTESSADNNITTTTEVDTSETDSNKRRMICPYSAESNFLIEVYDNVAPTPLDLYDGWIDPMNEKEFGLKPLAARWLNAGLSGQDTPGMLRAGLKRLRDSKHFLVEEPFRIQDELQMKAKALNDPTRKSDVFVFEEDSIDAQRECLELFLHYLPNRYPDLYQYESKTNCLYVKPLNETFHIDEWMMMDHNSDNLSTKCPLELCERIVQEDLILMRPSRPSDPFNQYAMAAAGVVFSFNELKKKLGQPVSFLHAPVPGYEKHIMKTIDITFSKLLKTECIMWRNNWGIAPNGKLDEPLYGSSSAHENRTMTNKPSRDEILSLHLEVEYQTIRRLPKSRYILFTVKSMIDPIHALKEVPNAAISLASSIRGMSRDMRKYKGIMNDDVCNALLEYLDEISM